MLCIVKSMLLLLLLVAKAIATSVDADVSDCVAGATWHKAPSGTAQVNQQASLPLQ